VSGKNVKLFLPLGLLVLAAGAGALWYTRPTPPATVTENPNPNVRPVAALDTAGYARAVGPIPLRFPKDHGAHPDFKLEWWYYTGNVSTPDGRRRFGYQFTLFRNALAPPDSGAERESEWAADQLYMGHLAVTDIASNKFYAFERFSRGAADLAGARAEPFRVWLEDWETAQVGPTMPPMRIRASEQGVQLDLTLSPIKPLVLQGKDGFSVKGPGTGNASYYYSYTRLQTNGRIETPEGSFEVEGLSWMDREWSTSLLNKHQVGWDWYSIQLSDRREIMSFTVRGQAGQPSFTDGAIVQPDGSRISLLPSDFTLGVTSTWSSPLDGAAYPAGWRMQIPSQRLDLTIVPAISNQELDLSVRYWEGAVTVRGTSGSRPIDGHGYVELTGYGTSTKTFNRELSIDELNAMPRDWNPGAKAPAAAPSSPPSGGGGESRSATKEPGAKRKTN
jgi:predicted secreted hydrolase